MSESNRLSLDHDSSEETVSPLRNITGPERVELPSNAYKSFALTVVLWACQSRLLMSGYQNQRLSIDVGFDDQTIISHSIFKVKKVLGCSRRYQAKRAPWRILHPQNMLIITCQSKNCQLEIFDNQLSKNAIY